MCQRCLMHGPWRCDAWTCMCLVDIETWTFKRSLTCLASWRNNSPWKLRSLPTTCRVKRTSHFFGHSVAHIPCYITFLGSSFCRGVESIKRVAISRGWGHSHCFQTMSSTWRTPTKTLFNVSPCPLQFRQEDLTYSGSLKMLHTYHPRVNGWLYVCAV